MDAALLFISAADEGTCLAVLADTDADAGLIAYEMAMLVKRVGSHLVAKPRSPEADHPRWVNHGHEGQTTTGWTGTLAPSPGPTP